MVVVETHPYLSPQIAGDSAVGMASINLALRTYVLSHYQACPQARGVLCTQNGTLGSQSICRSPSWHTHPWTLVTHSTWYFFHILNYDRKFSDNYVGVLIKVAWEEGKGCVVMKTDNIILAATFIYSMVLDLIVLLLSGIQLLRCGSHLQFASLLFKDGLIYFVIAYVVVLCLNACANQEIGFQVPGQSHSHCFYVS